MSKATKRKHVTREVLDEYTLPEDHQQIVKVTASRGNNLHEVQTATGEQFLVSMPTRFRKNVWIKRGDFVIVDPILEGDKVKAEITTILYPKQIKYIQKEGLWPDQFTSKPLHGEGEMGQPHNNQDVEVITKDLAGISLGDQAGRSDEEDSSDSDNDEDLFVNTNRPTVTYFYSDSSEEENSEEGDVGEGAGEEEKEEGGER
ncbi:probable RNA-binding protein EIF1AD [Acanthaster planci]|uniref:Probable RNA-binding protein EIF1AD n=1 Tax=Acanthaster planci TaxID=133434 RepID=A0A8B7YDB7_ACAPL|nr:probable RNA-binding protein EIF1AD [Acanthaster planci]